jgi:hypothetical protein
MDLKVLLQDPYTGHLRRTGWNTPEVEGFGFTATFTLISSLHARTSGPLSGVTVLAGGGFLHFGPLHFPFSDPTLVGACLQRGTIFYKPSLSNLLALKLASTFTIDLAPSLSRQSDNLATMSLPYLSSR